MAKANFKKGGGFLDGVVGVITDYQLTDEFNGEPYDPTKKIKDYKTGKPVAPPHTLNVLLSVVPDGAEEAITTNLRAGNFEEWEVSEDGHVLTPVEDGRALSGNSAWAKLMSSLEEAGHPTGVQSDDAEEGTYDFTPIIGSRCKFEQRVDAERTSKFGPRKDKKTGRTYDRRDLVVSEFYEIVEVGSGKSSKKAAKVGPVKAAGGKLNGKISKPEPIDDDLEAFTKETLLNILAAAGGPLAKNKLSTKVLTTIPKDPRREDVRKMVFSDEFLSQEDGWTYNKAKGYL